MDLQKGNVRSIFFRYLGAAFGSAMISSIYGIVDMAVVGQYQGPEGTAALAVVAPVWNIIYSLGLLMGVGGSVLLAVSRGRNNVKEQNGYFTVAVAGGVLLSVLSWLVLIFLEDEMLMLFGASEDILPLAASYLRPVRYVVPVFLFNQLLAAFLRNDDAPGLATAAVLAGGIFNVFGDIYFVFGLDMGIMGAGLATAIGASITLVIMLTHFFSRKNTLRIVRKPGFVKKVRRITVTGFSTFIIDVAMGILTMFFNRQIMKYLGTDALSVYGVIVNISTIVQCCAYSVGQAAQPLFSVNFGAGSSARVRETLRYAMLTAAAFGIVWTAVIWLWPNGFIRIFMNPTSEILEIAPAILRTYGISFLLLPVNIFSTYYFQAILRPKAAMGVSVLRGIIVSGALIYILPAVFGADAVWLAMPVTELVVVVLVAALMVKYTPQGGKKAWTRMISC